MTVLQVEKETRSDVSCAVPEARVGVVSFLNTQPLIFGLNGLRHWSLHPAPPSTLIDLLARDEVDVALCSSVDLLRAPFEPAWLAGVPLACRGATRTVRLFARRPVEAVDVIHCDPDSHTSIALLQVLLRDLWGVNPTIQPLKSIESDVECMLLIGDKVIAPELTDGTWPVQIDLGEAWESMTGLPFVFAVWMGRNDRLDVMMRAGRIFDRQLRLNQHRLCQVVSATAPDLGWPTDVASEYLSSAIRYRMGPRELEGLHAFLARVRVHGIAPDRDIPRPLFI